MRRASRILPRSSFMLKSKVRFSPYSSFNGYSSPPARMLDDDLGEPVSLEMQKALVDVKKLSTILKDRTFYGEVIDRHLQVRYFLNLTTKIRK